MTKEITKAIILQELQDKFKLRDFEPAKFLFDETVVPTYEIRDHVEHWQSLFTTMSITSAPATYKFFTVPDNERWHVRGYNVIFMASGAYTVTGVHTYRKETYHPVYLDMTLGQTVSYAVNLPQLLALNPGDALYVYVDSYTSTAALRMYLDFKKEEIR